MKSILVALSLLISSQAWAHGEDQFGPHGGYVRMPGAYHTEVVLDGPHKAKVYLLNMEWKNPTVKNSSVEIRHSANKTVISCTPASDHFECVFPKETNLKKKGQLIIQSQYEGQKGNEATYDLPLKLFKKDDGHGGHHH